MNKDLLCLCAQRFQVTKEYEHPAEGSYKACFASMTPEQEGTGFSNYLADRMLSNRRL